MKTASLDLLEPGMSSGLARGPNAEGVPFVWAYRRMEATGWVVGIGIPQSVFDEPILFGLGGMLIIGFVLAFLAAVVAYRTTGPLSQSIKELRDAVSALRREPRLALRKIAASSCHPLPMSAPGNGTSKGGYTPEAAAFLDSNTGENYLGAADAKVKKLFGIDVETGPTH